LTDADPRSCSQDSYAKVYVVTLRKGQSVVIDVESGDGDRSPSRASLTPTCGSRTRPESKLAYNDDISPTNYNSRLEFTRPAAVIIGCRHLLRAGAAGAYVLTVREK